MNAHEDGERPYKVAEKVSTPTLKAADLGENSDAATINSAPSDGAELLGDSEYDADLLNSKSIDAAMLALDAQKAAAKADLNGSNLGADAETVSLATTEEAVRKAQYSTEKLLKELPRLWLVLALIILLAYLPSLVMILGYVYWVFCTCKTSIICRKLFKDNAINPWIPSVAAFLPAIMLFAGSATASALGISDYSYAHAQMTMAYTIAGCFITYCIHWFWMFKSTCDLTRTEKGAKSSENISFKPAWLNASVHCLSFPAVMGFGVVCAVSLAYILGADRLEAFTEYFNAPLRIGISMSILASQFAGFFLLNRKIKAVARKEASAISAGRAAKITKPPISDDDYIVPYHPFEELERWFKQRTSQRSHKKLFYVLGVFLVFIAVGAPQWALNQLAYVAAGSAAGVGAAGAASLANANLFIVNAVQFAIWVCLLLGVGIYTSKPSHIGLSKKGVRFLWRHFLLNKDGAYLDWKFMERISLIMPPGKTAPTDQHIIFEGRAGQGKMDVRVGSIMETDQRARVLKAIEKFAPEVHRDAMVLQALEPPADHSYTELWLQALSAPPKRERFKPLTEGSKLHEERFIIKRQLGVGGQGTAYLATDSETGEDIVLKEFILPVYVDVSVRRQSLERFENEARILKQLDHPQIVKLGDFFVEDHRSYLVLEHIDGQSLKEIVDKEGALPEERVRALGKQMCDILEYLHGLEPAVVHRDFTPDNLILRKDGTLKLVDFNVAQQTESTATGTVVGKHAYLPPEQFRGTPGTRSDIYAMGATLHFLLTGKDPEPISVSHPKRINPEVSDQMNVLVEVATAITEEARYSNALEVKQALE